MKTLKVSVIILAVSLLVSGAGVLATNVKKYAGIDLPSWRGTYETNSYYKSVKGIQLYENEYNINLCNGNYDNISVRLYSSNKDDYSSWMTVSNGATSSWENNSITNVKGDYTLYIRNNVFSLCESQHSGNWYLEK